MSIMCFSYRGFSEMFALLNVVVICDRLVHRLCFMPSAFVGLIDRSLSVS